MQSAAGALAEREGGRGSLRGKRGSGGSWNSSNCCYHLAAHAWGPALLPARLSEGAGASGSKVLEGRLYFQEPSGAALVFFFSCKEHLFEDSAPFPGLKEVFCVIKHVFSLKAGMGFGKKITQRRIWKQMCRGVVGFSLPPLYSRA